VRARSVAKERSTRAIRVGVQIVCAVAVASLAERSKGAEQAPVDWESVGDRAARLLGDYIRINTENPPGRTAEAVEFLEPLLRQSGMETQRLAAQPDKPILLARLRGTRRHKKPIVLLNHMDVVPADPREWSFPPFAGDVADGMVRGRGAIDMKGLAIAQLLALHLLADRGERPRRDIVFLAVPDEEVGGTAGTKWLAEQHPQILDATGVWDEGGYGVSGLFPAPLLLISVTEKKVLWIRLVATGPSGHGSRPFPETAPMRLLRALDRVFGNLPQARLTRLSSRMLSRIGPSVPGVTGFAMRNAHNPFVWLFARRILEQDPLINTLVRDTVALTMLDGGYKPNVIPERASAVLDCRLLPDRDQDRFLAELARVIDDEHVAIEIIQATEPAAYSSTRTALYRAMETAAKAVYPDAVVSPFMTSVGTDSRFFRRRGVPAYGFLPALLPQELLATVHGADERIPVATLGPAVRVLYEALRRM